MEEEYEPKLRTNLLRESKENKLTAAIREQMIDLVNIAKRDHGISNYKICKVATITPSTLSNILSRRRSISLPLLVKIIDVLGYKVIIVPKSVGTPAEVRSDEN